ncbi:MAG: MFS transporter [Parcubacteria group bacterium]|nr:MFS transporter [Parcubacteria group bacterium]MCR4342291.1 MFS transporter [Patescibacteria group bacterium]
MAKKKMLRILYSAGFLFAIHSAFIAYIDSSFLSKFVGEKYVGLIFTISAILSIYALSKASLVLSKLGNYKTTISLLILEAFLLAGLASIKIAWIAVPFFIIHYAILTLLILNFDIFIEHFSDDGATGSIRGTFLSIINLSWVIAPFIAGLILTNSDFWKIYLLSASAMIPVFAIISLKFKNVRDNHYNHPPFLETIKRVFQNKNIYKIFLASFLLYFFFSWMIIYTPIYLNQHIGFAWDKIGIIFTIMLLPYILFELPLGKLADWRFGEKEFLTIGFIIIGISTMAMAFIDSHNFLVWAAILFITRIGGSFVEISSESYFFKQIDDTDTNIISFFRNTRPLAFVIAPLIATIILKILPYQYLFLVLGIIMLFGLKYSLTLRDTK